MQNLIAKPDCNIFSKIHDMYSTDLRRRYALSYNSLIFAHIAGSHAYGMSNANSDVDVRGIFAVNQDDYYLLGDEPPVEHLVDYKVDKVTGKVIEKSDICLYGLRKFMGLLATANPNIIEMLYIPEDCILFSHPVMETIVSKRSSFITKKAYESHVKYAMSQISKARGANKRVHNKKPESRPSVLDFAYFCSERGTDMPFRPFPCSEMKSRVGFELKDCKASSMEHDPNSYRVYLCPESANGVIVNNAVACKSISIEEEKSNFVGILIFNSDAYKRELKEWTEYWEWERNKNPNRWKNQEDKSVDYDSKNMAHCVRLLKSALNIFENGEPLVRLSDGPDKNLLLDIRHGLLKYGQIMDIANQTLAKLEDAKLKSNLPESIDYYDVNTIMKDCAYGLSSIRNFRNFDNCDQFKEWTSARWDCIAKKDKSWFPGADFSIELNKIYKEDKANNTFTKFDLPCCPF